MQLDLCVKYVDENNIGPVSKALQELLTRGVGLPTKCGTASMIASLTLVVLEPSNWISRRSDERANKLFPCSVLTL